MSMYLDKNYKIIYNKLVKTNRSYYISLFNYNIHKAAIFKNPREAELALKFISTYKEFNILYFNCKIDTIAYSSVATREIIDIVLKEIKEHNSIPYQYTTFSNQCNDFLTNNKTHIQDTAFFASFKQKAALLDKLVKHYEKNGTDGLLKIFDDPSNAQPT